MVCSSTSDAFSPCPARFARAVSSTLTSRPDLGPRAGEEDAVSGCDVAFAAAHRINVEG
jgi:hypothetical protein